MVLCVTESRPRYLNNSDPGKNPKLGSATRVLFTIFEDLFFLLQTTALLRICLMNIFPAVQAISEFEPALAGEHAEENAGGRQGGKGEGC